MNILIDGQTLQTPEINRGIGIYFKNVLNNMVKLSYVHNWYITVGDRSCLTALDPWVVKRLTPVEHEIFFPIVDYDCTSAYTNELEKVIEEKKIDVFWSPNPLMVNVRFINRNLKCKVYATIHDIIPHILPITEWSRTIRHEYARRLEFLKKGTVSLLCDSNSTKEDFEKHIGPHPSMYVTPLAADSRKFYRRRQKTGTSEDVSIVFTGGFDHRKNLTGALRAFSIACKKYQGNHLMDRAKLIIVCSASQNDQEQFYNMAEESGVRNRVVLTGFISDQDLAELYFRCSVFFFPSLYEGFGLPIIEAMLAGAFILSADNSSLPEVCGGHAILCDANNIDDMSDKIMEALTAAECETLSEKQRRQEYALTYSWQKTARQTLAAFENGGICKKTAMENRAEKKKLAIITPWPEQKTGIANFVYKLIPYLAAYYEVDIFVDNSSGSNEKFLENKYGRLYMLGELDQHHNDYDYLLYQIGNNAEYHSGIYQYLRKYPGIAEIHDYILHPFFYHAYFLKGEKNIYRTALSEGYGETGLQHYREVRDKRAYPDEKTFSMSQSVAAISKKVVFHNHWSENQMRDVSAAVIPLACFEEEKKTEEQQEQLINELKRKYGLKKTEIVVSCFGFISENKRPEVLLRVCRQLQSRGYPVKLVFWGKLGMENLEDSIQRLGLTDAVLITGYLERTEYEAGVAISDIVINLRYPSMGESSGTLCETFKCGKPVIVTDINQYQEYPDEICWKVPVGAGEEKILTEMIAYLIDHPNVREALGKNAQLYAEKILSPVQVAKLYREMLEQV